MTFLTLNPLKTQYILKEFKTHMNFHPSYLKYVCRSFKIDRGVRA